MNDVDLPALFEADGHRLIQRGAEWRCLCPAHDDHTPSCTLYNKGDKWRFKCFSCGWQGDAADYLRDRHGMSAREALKATGQAEPRPERAPPPTPKPKPLLKSPPDCDVRYLYRDRDDRVVVVVQRWEATQSKKKRFTPYTRAPGGWIQGLEIPKDRPLYRLPHLLRGDPARQIVIVEGEKCADAVASLSQKTIVTTWMSGAQAWRLTDFTPTHGRKLLLVADGDAAGHESMTKLAAALHPHCPEINLVLPPLPAEGEKSKDVADVIAETPKKVSQWIAAHAALYSPETFPSDPETPPRTERAAQRRTARVNGAPILAGDGAHFAIVKREGGRTVFRLAEGVEISVPTEQEAQMKGRLAPRQWWTKQ